MEKQKPSADRCTTGGLMPGCMDCLAKLASDAARMAAPDEPELEAKAQRSAMEILETADLERVTAPELANRAMRAIAGITGVNDPYYQVKGIELEKAREALEGVRPLFGDSLGDLLRLAALGNSLDFFLPPEEVVERVRADVESGFSFYRDDTARLEAFLETRPNRILYMTDNSGEFHFDLPLYEHLTRKAGEVVLVVKGGPGLNDLTRAELDRAGLTGRVARLEDTGTDGAGVDWERVSETFLGLLNSADLLLAKGMANMETLSSRPLPLPAFLLFKVKCRPIQNLINAPQGSYQARWVDPLGG